MIRRLAAIGASFPIALSGQTLDAARFRNPPADARPALLWSWSGQITDTSLFVVDLRSSRTPEQVRAQIGAQASSSAGGSRHIAVAIDSANPLVSALPDLATWIARVTELGRGRSAAKMAVLVETRDSAFARLIDRLERVQAIFDVVPGAALEKSVAGPGELQTAGQSYHAVVVPPGAALTRAIVARLAMLSRDGGTVIAWRPLPSVGVAWPDTGARFHVLDSLPQLREALIRTPWSGVREPGPPALRIRALERGEDRVFILFNASDRRIPIAPTFRMIGQPELWDPDDGAVRFAPTRWSPRLAVTDVPIELDPFQVVGIVFKGKSNSPRGPIDAPPMERTAARSDSTWRVRFVSGDTTWRPGALGSWTAVDSTYSGAALYEGTLQLTAVESGHYWLDLGQVHEIADIELNGQPLGRRMWRPYRFDVTKIVQQGINRLSVRVTNTLANRTGTPLPSGLLGPVRLIFVR